MKKNILIINTGGTISSIITKNGYEPAQGYVEQALKNIESLKHRDMPHYHILEYDPLLDSSNMTVHDWNRIANDIHSHHDQYDGFVVLHGTDTLAYTASALSFMLEQLGKPVIVTGSQIPLSEVRNDAIDNIITSLWLCQHETIHEVCVLFGQQLLRGNRAQKTSAQRFNAFESPNFPPLAKIGININLNKTSLMQSPSKPLQLQDIEPHFIANLRLFPGLSSKVVEFILSQPIKGLILETYGAGNAPNNDAHFLKLLDDATNRGIIIVNCSQCPHGKVSMDDYATGNSLKQAGLISGKDMTPEAAHCKLLYLLSKLKTTEQVKTQMEKNLCGELTE
jgi:L-asparaginase